MISNIFVFKSKRQIEESKTKTEQLNPATGEWEETTPEPYYFGLVPFLWKRVIGWRDKQERKAQFIGWSEFSLF